MDESDVARWQPLRGGMVAASATVLAAAGHTFGGGRLPDLAVLVPAAAGLGWVSSGLARRRMRFPTLLTVLAAAQIGFHLLFLVPTATPVSSPMMPGMPGMPAPGASSWLGMVGFHALAAVLTAAVLAGAEKALSTLAQPVRVFRLLAKPLRVPSVPTRWWTVITACVPSIGPAATPRGPAPRRGPPAGWC